MPMWGNSPVAETLALILKSAVGDEQVACRDEIKHAMYRVVSYREDFNYLWNLRKGTTASNKFSPSRAEGEIFDWVRSEAGAEGRILVLVWDGMPTSEESTINVGDYVTPYDWSIAFSWNIFSKWSENRSQPSSSKLHLPELRLVFLDLKSQEHSGSFGHKVFPALGQAVPWVQSYRVLNSECIELAVLPCEDTGAFARLRSVVPAGAFGAECLLRDLVDPQRILSIYEAQEDRDRGVVLRALVELWMNQLVRPNNRHHVGNLVSPMLLAKGLDRPSSSLREVAIQTIEREAPLRRALSTLLEWIELVRQTDSGPHVSSEGLLSGKTDDKDLFDRRNNLVFLLIDDQYELGYNHVLGFVLFGNRYNQDSIENGPHWAFILPQVATLHCEKTIEHLLKRLDQFGKIKNWNAVRFADLSCDILLLDLRLWTDSSEQKKFMKLIVDACQSLGADKTIKDAVFLTAFEAAQTTAETGELECVEAIVLLPLLLSYIDPSIPIILFSSTHQTFVLQMVAHRPNIITTFTKPILDGYTETRTPSDYVGDLVRALRKAIDMHEARLVWRELAKVYETSKAGPLLMRVRHILSNGRPLEYTVTSEAIENLASEYLHSLATARFADSLMVPSNWLEGLNLEPYRPASALIGELLTEHAPKNLTLTEDSQRHRDFYKGIKTLTTVDDRIWESAIQPDVSYAVFWVVDKFRNLRAHYDIRVNPILS